MSDMDSDTAMRLAAFAHVRRLIELRETGTASDLAPGFQFDGARIPLINLRRIRFATGSRNGGVGRADRESGRKVSVPPLLRAFVSPLPGRGRDSANGPVRRRMSGRRRICWLSI
jgi:hypothetical protein